MNVNQLSPIESLMVVGISLGFLCGLPYISHAKLEPLNNREASGITVKGFSNGLLLKTASDVDRTYRLNPSKDSGQLLKTVVDNEGLLSRSNLRRATAISKNPDILRVVGEITNEVDTILGVLEGTSFVRGMDQFSAAFLNQAEFHSESDRTLLKNQFDQVLSGS